MNDSNINWRTNPATGRPEAVPRVESMPAPAAAVPPPNAFQRPQLRPLIHDNDAPGAKHQSLTFRTHSNGLEKAQAAYARIMDGAIARGLFNPETNEWSDDRASLREVALTQMQAEQARQAVAYEASVVPALQADRDAILEAAHEEQTRESIGRMEAALAGKPLTSRVVTIEEPDGSKNHVVVGGPAWPADLSAPTKIN